MKQWLLFCLLCSLIYAMATHAAPVKFKTALSKTILTAELLYWNQQTLAVQDCALFMPDLGDDTNMVIRNLRSKGYSPQVIPLITKLDSTQADSNGHRVQDTFTEMSPDLKRYGRHTLILSVTGFAHERKKKHKYTLRLHRLGGQEAELAKSTKTGTLGQGRYSIADLPRCRPKI